jgi:hypothetical protein
MRRALYVMVSIGLLTSLSVACAATGARVDELRSAASERRDSSTDSDETGFCLSLARAAAAIESGSPETAEEATEETLARAPDEIAEAARAVAETVRDARDGDDWDADDPDLTDAVEHLSQTASSTCAPE